MHARHLVTAALLLGLVSILASACIVAPQEDIAADAEALADSDPVDVTARFMCKGLGVVECMIQCAQQGTPCRPRREHPHNASAGKGDLYACRTSAPRSCDYLYSNGDRCFFFTDPTMVRCLHRGG